MCTPPRTASMSKPIEAICRSKLGRVCSRETYKHFACSCRAFPWRIEYVKVDFIVPGRPETRMTWPSGRPPPSSSSSPSMNVGIFFGSKAGYPQRVRESVIRHGRPNRSSFQSKSDSSRIRSISASANARQHPIHEEFHQAVEAFLSRRHRAPSRGRSFAPPASEDRLHLSRGTFHRHEHQAQVCVVIDEGDEERLVARTEAQELPFVRLDDRADETALVKLDRRHL